MFSQDRVTEPQALCGCSSLNERWIRMSSNESFDVDGSSMFLVRFSFPSWDLNRRSSLRLRTVSTMIELFGRCRLRPRIVVWRMLVVIGWSNRRRSSKRCSFTRESLVSVSRSLARLDTIQIILIIKLIVMMMIIIIYSLMRKGATGAGPWPFSPFIHSFQLAALVGEKRGCFYRFGRVTITTRSVAASRWSQKAV